MKIKIIAFSALIILVLAAIYFFVVLPYQVKRENDYKKEIESLRNEILETKKEIQDIEENEPTIDTSYVDSQMDELRYEMQVQQEELEYEERQRGWCEDGGGIYYGDGTCITSN